ncbi:MAG: CHAT domain-containing tetratricopeptide repeat protein [Novosphingobium sp.]
MKVIYAAALMLAAPALANPAATAPVALPGAVPADTMIDAMIDPVAALAQADRVLAQARDEPARHDAQIARAAALTQLDRNVEALSALDQARGGPDAKAPARQGQLALMMAQVLANQQNYPAAEAQLRTARAARGAVYGEDSAEVAEVDSFLSAVLISQGKGEAGIAAARHGWTVLSAARPPQDAGRIAVGRSLAHALSIYRHDEESEALFRRLMADILLLPPGHNYRITLPRIFGGALLRQGRMGEALPLLQQAVEQSEQSAAVIKGERADMMGVLGYTLLSLDRPGDALPFFERQMELAQEGGEPTSIVRACFGLAQAADRAGHRDTGLAWRQKAAAILSALPQPARVETALNNFKLGPSLAHAGQLAEAEAVESAAVTAIAGFRPESHFQTTNSRIALGWIKALRGQTTEGLELVRRNFLLSVATNEQMEVSKNQVVGVLDNIEAYSQALQTAVLAGDNEFAFQVLQVMVETDASRAAVAVTQREQSGNTALGTLLRRRQQASADKADADQVMTALLTAGQASEAERTAAVQRLAQRTAALAVLDGELDAAFPAFRALLRPRRLTLAEAQARLRPDEALLISAESDLGLYTLALTRKGVALGRDPIRRHDLRALVSRVRSGIEMGRAEDFDIAAAAALYRGIFTPPVAALVRPHMRLRLAIGDILSTLPLSLLVSRPSTSLKGARFLIEDHAMSIVPSLWAMGGDRSTGSASGRLVAVGAPDPGSGNSAKRSPGLDLAPLPGAVGEMAAIARSLSRYGTPVVLSGSAATEAALRALDLHKLGVLLFATHGLVAGAFDLHSEPALVLSSGGSGTANDGLLSASEAAQLDTDAQWVILSACDTAGGSQPSAAGYTGLARAFLFAGARRVVASHWPVRDDISPRLSLGIVDAMRRTGTADAALRVAILAVMHDKTLADARNPALWAPYMVVTR